MKRWSGVLLSLVLGAALAAGSFLDSAGFRALEPEARQAIVLAVKSREVGPRLARYPGWTAGAEQIEDRIWHVWFEREEEWLGEAYVDLATKAVRDVYLPIEPTEAERARALPLLRKAVLADPEVRALVEVPAEWDEEIVYDKWEEAWFVYYWRGDDAVGVRLERQDGRYRVLEVFDPLELDAAQQRRHDQDRAIQIAYAAEAVGRALEPYDDWTTYAQPLGDGRWTVDFATGDMTVLSVLVDLPGGRVLAVEAP